MLKQTVFWKTPSLGCTRHQMISVLHFYVCLSVGTLLLFEYCTWLGGTKPLVLANRLSGASDLLGRDVLDFTGDTWQQEKETKVLCEAWNTAELWHKAISLPKGVNISLKAWACTIMQESGPCPQSE